MDVRVEPKMQVFKMRAPLLEKGKKDSPLFMADGMWAHLKVYADGGENELHSHPSEDHAFFVLEGQATFYGTDNTTTIVSQYEGVWLVRGVVYRFHNSGPSNLIMLRVGTGTNPYNNVHGDNRRDEHGKLMPATQTELTGAVVRPGAFFGAAG